MASSERPIRRLDLSGGWVGDDDWTNPANVPPQTARRLKFTSSAVHFALVGKSGTSDAATNVDIGTLTVDAWLGLEIGSGVIRGQTIIEATGAELSTRIRIVSTDVTPGRYGWLNLATLTNVGALPALWVYIISGARPV